VSHQAASSAHKQAWRDFVFGRAMQEWRARPLVGWPLKFVMVYLSDDPSPGDINNFVKPVQDALSGCVYADDAMVRDVSAHFRYLGEPNAISGLPGMLAEALVRGDTCVYVAVHDSNELAKELI
jgi:Holliday junction resolvase RusA-like endonuclease